MMEISRFLKKVLKFSRFFNRLRQFIFMQYSLKYLICLVKFELMLTLYTVTLSLSLLVLTRLVVYLDAVGALKGDLL
jgi:hypothetical protein